MQGKPYKKKTWKADVLKKNKTVLTKSSSACGRMGFSDREQTSKHSSLNFI